MILQLQVLLSYTMISLGTLTLVVVLACTGVRINEQHWVDRLAWHVRVDRVSAKFEASNFNSQAHKSMQYNARVQIHGVKKTERTPAACAGRSEYIHLVFAACSLVCIRWVVRNQFTVLMVSTFDHHECVCLPMSLHRSSLEEASCAARTPE